ncbi:glycoside hydrolase superfamily [Lactarius indigo]|nr:glycoside hydrolase superfamily [Lactarius indigo]
MFLKPTVVWATCRFSGCLTFGSRSHHDHRNTPGARRSGLAKPHGPPVVHRNCSSIHHFLTSKLPTISPVMTVFDGLTFSAHRGRPYPPRSSRRALAPACNLRTSSLTPSASVPLSPSTSRPPMNSKDLLAPAERTPTPFFNNNLGGLGTDAAQTTSPPSGVRYRSPVSRSASTEGLRRHSGLSQRRRRSYSTGETRRIASSFPLTLWYTLSGTVYTLGVPVTTQDLRPSRGFMLDTARNSRPASRYQTSNAFSTRCLGSVTVNFTIGLLSAVVKLFPSTLFGTCGDEINARCDQDDAQTQHDLGGKTIAQALDTVTQATQAALRSLGKTPVVWEEMVHSFNLTLSNDTIALVWISSDNAAAVAAKGFRFVHATSNSFYLDCGAGGWVGANPGGNSWSQAPLVLGGQQLLWTEQSGPQNLDSIVWPRAAASAEVFWSGAGGNEPRGADYRAAARVCERAANQLEMG